MYGKSSQTVLTVWLAMALSAAAATSTPEQWSLDIAKVQQGEWWRLVSGHLVHLSWQHYRYDLLALGMVFYICSRLGEKFHTIAFSGLFSASATSAVVMIVHPVDIYCGVSGITAGLLSFAALLLIVQGARISGYVVLVAMLFKTCLEWRGISASGVAPVWQAHCAGAAAGVCVAVLSLKRKFQIIPQRGMGRPP